MSKIVLDADNDLVRANLEQVLHRQAFVTRHHEALRAVQDDDARDHYEEWYLAALEDGLFRRVLVIEFREWSRHLEDLLRDQLSRNGQDSGLWDEAEARLGPTAIVAAAREILESRLDAKLAEPIWEGLEELGQVAETISQGTREARQTLRDAYPDYFNDLDAFGDGDPVGRLTLRREQIDRIFSIVKAFWDPDSGLPYQKA